MCEFPSDTPTMDQETTAKKKRRSFVERQLESNLSDRLTRLDPGINGQRRSRSYHFPQYDLIKRKPRRAKAVNVAKRRAHSHSEIGKSILLSYSEARNIASCIDWKRRWRRLIKSCMKMLLFVVSYRKIESCWVSKRPNLQCTRYVLIWAHDSCDN